MHNEKRKWLLQFVFQTFLINVLVLCLTLIILFQYDFTEIFKDNRPIPILMVLGLGLCLNLGSSMMLKAKIKKRSSVLVDILKRLSEGDTNIEVDGFDHHRDELWQAVLTLTNSLKEYANAGKQLAEGQLSKEIRPLSNNDVLGKSLRSIARSLSILEEETELLTKKNSAGFEAISSELPGFYSTILASINKTINFQVEKSMLYEQAMDAIPYPLHILNLNGQWLFFNKVLEELLQKAGLIENRETAYYQKCCEFGIADCNSKECPERCSIFQLITKGLTTFDFEFMGCYNQKNSRFIKNSQNENIGIIEITMDLTPSVSVNNSTFPALKFS